MDDSVLVRVVEGAVHAGRDALRILDRQLPLTIEPRAERLSLDERHDVVEQSIRLAAVEERQQVRVLQAGGDTDLGQKPVDAQHGTQVGMQHLERDPALVPDVAGNIQGRHAASPCLSLDQVAIVKR